MSSIPRRPLSLVWTESFLFAGWSALLLLIAGLFPGYWYLSFVALTPFLYRIVRASTSEAARLGFLLGLIYFIVSGIGGLFVDPALTTIRVAAGTALFTTFGLAVGLARRRWGFNPVIVALLWVVFELGLIRLGYAGGLFGGAEISNPFFHGLAALFGFLIVSCIIVIFNSVLVLAIEKVITLARARSRVASAGRRTCAFNLTAPRLSQNSYLVPEGRGPPAVLC